MTDQIVNCANWPGDCRCVLAHPGDADLNRGHFAHVPQHSPHTFEIILHGDEVWQTTLDG
jgi:hypothetical protein